jgi:hypothetical protein
MKPKQHFAVFVKALGVWALVTGLGTLPDASFRVRQFSDPQDLFFMVMGSIAEPLLLCACGFWLIHFNWITRMAYSRITTSDGISTEHADSGTTLELFSAILKTLGVWYLLQGIIRIPFGFNSLDTAKFSPPLVAFRIEAFVTPAIPIAIGGLLLIATNWFIALGFPEWLADDNADEAEIKSRTGQQALFAVIVKALGVFVTVNGLTKLPHTITQASFVSSNPDALKIYAQLFAIPVMSILLGALCFFATNFFTNLAFSKPKALSADESADPAM